MSVRQVSKSHRIAPVISTQGPASAESIFLVPTAPRSNAKAEQLAELGYQHIRAGQWPAAVDKLKQARAADPQSPMILNRLSVALSHLDPPQYNQARACIDEALRLSPGYPQALYNLAVDELRRGKVDEALNGLSQLVEQSGAYRDGAAKDADWDALRPPKERLKMSPSVPPKVTQAQAKRFAALTS